MAVEMAEGKNPYSRFKNILAIINGIPTAPPPRLGLGPSDEVVDLSSNGDPSVDISDNIEIDVSNVNDAAKDVEGDTVKLHSSLNIYLPPPRSEFRAPRRQWSKDFHEFIKCLLLKDPKKFVNALSYESQSMFLYTMEMFEL